MLDRVVLRVDGIAQIVADKADITDLTAATARITNLEATSITTTNLSAKVADLGYLKADTAELTFATITNLNGLQGSFDTLNTKAITTDNLSTKVANLGYLKANMANLDTANINKANIGTLLADVGLITSAVIAEGHVTGTLDSVDINANRIKAGTLSVDRLVLNGTTDSIVYALNNRGQLTSTHCDTLDGGILTERTITPDRIVAHSITSKEIDVDSLFAKDVMASHSIYSPNIIGGSFETSNIEGNSYTNHTLKIHNGTVNFYDEINNYIGGVASRSGTNYNSYSVKGLDFYTKDGYMEFSYMNVSPKVAYILDSSALQHHTFNGDVRVNDNLDVRLKASATEFCENGVRLEAKYLQLAGGTLTGGIKRNGNAIVNTGTNGSTNFCGGTNLSNGANLILRGSTQTGYEGQFCLDARSGSNITSLIGHPNGTLTWGSTTILRSDNFNDYAVKRVQNGSFYALDEESTWIQTPTSGIIPRANNTCNIGANGWQFENIRSQNFYEDTVKLSDKYLQLSGGTLSGNLKVANSSSSGSVSMWNDGEGGNIEIKGSSNTYGYQIDACGDSQFRCYMFKVSPWTYMTHWVLDADGFHTNKNLYAAQDLSISRDAYITRNTSIGGTLNGYNIGGSVTSNNNGLVTGGTVYNKLGAIQIIGVIETSVLKSSSSVANGGTANVTVSYSEYGTDSSIGVMIIPSLTQYCNVTTKASNTTAKTTTFTLTNTSGASHTIGASFVKIYYKNKTQM